MRRLLSCSVLTLVIAQSFAQTTNPRLVSEFDLHQIGLDTPRKGETSVGWMKILFLSESQLLVAALHGTDRSQTVRLIVLDVERASLRQTKDLDYKDWGTPNLRTSDGEFAIRQKNNIMYCNTSLECRQGPQVADRWQFSPDGSHFVQGPWPWTTSKDSTWVEYDRDGRKVASFSEDPHSLFVPANTGTFFGLPSEVHYFAEGRSSPISLHDCESAKLIGIANDQSVVCMVGNPQPIVVDASGAERYRLNLHGLSWNPHFVSSADGERFGLEWTSNTRAQLLEPLACIDECPNPSVQQFTVFSTSNGRLLGQFKWDPRPTNLYVVPGPFAFGKTGGHDPGPCVENLFLGVTAVQPRENPWKTSSPPVRITGSSDADVLN
jgi:hypothetical protein